MPPCLRARRSSAARLTHISHADSDQHGKYAAGMMLMPVNRVLQTCHRQLCRDVASADAISLCERETEMGLRAGKEKRRIPWQFTITK
jgi:hypothetical protein